MAESRVPSVSVVIPTYEGAQRLEGILQPLLGDPAVLEVIVVVDGCRDGSLELLNEIRRRNPKLKPKFIENSGEMHARAVGAMEAEGDVVLSLDHDVLAEPGLVAGHARRHVGRSRLLVLGYMPVTLSPQRSRHDFATRLYAAGYEERCQIYDREPQSVLLALWGGNFSMRRDELVSLGVVEATHYHADRDFGLRLLEAGFEAVFDRTLRARHLHDRPLRAFVRDARSQGAGRWLLHGLHRELLGALTPTAFEEGLPRPARALLRGTRRPRVRALLTPTLHAAIHGTGYVRFWRGQDLTAKFLRRVEEQRGAIDAAQGRAWGRVRTYAADLGDAGEREIVTAGSRSPRSRS
jgi:hypothetical protein